MLHKYNETFYPNACHVCKWFGKESHLKRCGNCRMISYCSKEHQKRHWPWHKELCLTISKVKASKGSTIFNNKQPLSPEEWTQIKMNFMLLVGLELSRKLEVYEQEMFKFLRACTVCYEQDPEKLEDCNNCPSTAICTEHKNDPIHKNFCPELKLSFDLDIALTTNEVQTPNMEISYNINQDHFPEGLKIFINKYIKCLRIPELSVEQELSLCSEYLTRPVTFLYAIRKLKHSFKSNSIVIHLIGANILEVVGIKLWEILFHWLPQLKTITIILIGPELSKCSITSNLCESCSSSQRQLLFEVYNVLYQKYINTIEFIKPDFIVCYNAGIHECEEYNSVNDTWAPVVREIFNQKCPFILTSYTLQEAEKEQERLKIILRNDIKYTYYEKNPYSSLRPYRDFATAGVYYQNQYLIVYKSLGTS